MDYLFKNTTSGDITKDGCYFKGDCIEVRPYGYFKGHPHLHVIGVQNEISPVKSDIAVEQKDGDVLVRRRKYALDEAEFDKIFKDKSRVEMTMLEFNAIVNDNKKLIDRGSAAIAARIR